MPRITILQPFKFAHHGYQVEEFLPGSDAVETTDECAELAIAQGWATDEAAAPAAPEAAPTAVAAQAPENKDAAPIRSVKG